MNEAPAPPPSPSSTGPEPGPPRPRPQGLRGENTVVGLIRPNGAVILLGLLCALAVVETIAAFLEYRERIDEEDWREIAAILSTNEDAPLIVASEWLGPSARMRLPAARRLDAVAYPDLRAFDRFFVLAHARERPWSGFLRAELEGLPRPELLGVHRAGDLSVLEYRQDAPEVTMSLLDLPLELEIEPGGRPCVERHGSFRCKGGRAAIRIVEVDYRPRRCLALELDDGLIARVDLGEVELGEVLRGHVGFGDFNARLRADPLARLELWIDGALAARWLFTDDQGWAAFALATSPGRHRVELRASTSVGGTWQRSGHQSSPTDTLCVELRSFDEERGPS